MTSDSNHHHGHGHGDGYRYDDTWVPEALKSFVRDRAWPDAPVAVDLGCGTGADAMWLADAGFDVVAVDLNSDALERAAARAAAADIDVRWERADVLDVPVDDGSVQLAIDRGCLHHLPIRDWSAYAGEVARILSPDGVLAVFDTATGHHHGHAITEQRLTDHFVRDGIAIVEMRPIVFDRPERDIPAVLAVFSRPGPLR